MNIEVGLTAAWRGEASGEDEYRPGPSGHAGLHYSF